MARAAHAPRAPRAARASRALLLLAASLPPLATLGAPPPPCVFSAALPGVYVNQPCAGAVPPGAGPCLNFSTPAAAMAACGAEATCSGVSSQAGGAGPWETRAGAALSSATGKVSYVVTNEAACGHAPPQAVVGFHNASLDADGNLLPPAFFNHSVQRAMDASVAYYASAPPASFSHGFPPWVWSTFTNGNYTPTSTDIVAAMSDGLGILSYVKYFHRAAAGRGGNATAAMQGARWLADYLIAFAATWPVGAWPSVARSTGVNSEWPLNHSAQHDANSGQNCIETDKVGIVGYALLKLHEATGEAAAGAPYFEAALHHARVLAANMRAGNATDAPWPWRVDSVSGAALWGRKNANMVFNLRLFRALAAPPYSLAEFAGPAAALWQWVEDVLLLSADPTVPANASMFVNFYEDRPFHYNEEIDRTSWPALMLANYLLEEREGLDAQWQAHVGALVGYALTLFGHTKDPYGVPYVGNVTLTGEQDDDNRGWGGAGSKLGGVMARWACSGAGPPWARQMALNNLAQVSYFSDVDGCRTDAVWFTGPGIRDGRGGWTEDCWLDVLHSVVDGLEALDGVC